MLILLKMEQEGKMGMQSELCSKYMYGITTMKHPQIINIC
jgi:hypothetical protein